MENTTIAGFHHLTAIVEDPQQNIDFYTRVLGQRLVKQTVNLDDPGTYHLYYGDEVGTHLKLPPWLESSRPQIEKVLLPIHVPEENTGRSKNE